MSETELIAELQMLAGLNEPRRGGPYQGAAAERCVAAMAKAATALQQALAERDAARAALSAETEACADLERRAHATIFGLTARITEYEMALDDLDAAEAAFEEADGHADMTYFEDQIAEAIMVAVRVRRASIRQRQGER